VITIEDLVKKFGGMVYRLAYLYTSDKEAAEDIRQEVFLAAFRYISKIEQPKAWLVRSTINRARNYHRSKYRHPEIDLPEEPYIPDHDSERLYEENEVINAVLQLPLIYREVIILYYYQGFTTVEIARELNIPESTIRVRMQRARTELRRILEGVNGE
jgi:RNA polymerase sigma-70 factor (ECF subfamily)